LKGNIKLDNRWIVPYNPTLLKKYQAHINVEWCNKTIFVKYLFKYVTKGPDCSKIYLQRIRNGEDVPYDEETSSRNEVKEYLDTRYICEQDSCWRIYGFDYIDIILPLGDYLCIYLMKIISLMMHMLILNELHLMYFIREQC
jgi:hypothetical protein